MDFDFFDMMGLSSEGFSFEDMMACDIVVIGPLSQTNTLSGEAFWQSVILSPFGYEISLFVRPEEEDALKNIQAGAGSYGIRVSDDIAEDLKKCKVISVTGLFDEDSLPLDEMSNILKTGKENGAIICVDPGDFLLINKEDAIKKLKVLSPYIDYFMPNEEEASFLTGKKFVFEMAAELLDMGIDNVIITRGEQGCYVRGNSAPFAMGAILRDDPDTSGAGANFAAGFIYGLFQDWQLKTCCEFAAGCATASLAYENATDGARERKDQIKKILNNPYL